MQIFATDKTVRNDTIKGLKDFNLQSLTTQARKGEQLVSMMPAIKKAFTLMGDDLVELHTQNENLKRKLDVTMKNGSKNLKQNCYNRSMMRKKSKFNCLGWKNRWKNSTNWLILVIKKGGKGSLITSFLKEINYNIWKILNWNSKYMTLIRKMK